MRKLSLYTIFLLFHALLFSQTPATKIDSMLVDIDKSSLSTEILYDRTTSWADLKNFNSQNKIADVNFFEQAFLEIRKASLDSLWIPLRDLKKQFASDSIYHKVDIAILNAVYNSINYDSEEEQLGALKIENNKFQELNNGKPIFKEHHTLVISPTKMYLRGSSIQYAIKDEFLFEIAQGKTIKSLIANFDTSQDYTLIDNGVFANQTIPISYQEDGIKTLTFTAVFENNTTKSVQAVVHVITANYVPPTPDSSNGFINATIPFQGYDEPTAVNGRLYYRIFFGNTQQKILKPCIIIDGFDPGDKRKIRDVDSNLPPDEHTSIVEMMTYFDENGNPTPIIPILNGLGYDVIIVNHPTYVKNGIEIDGGADYIERNGLTHVALYEFINNKLDQNNSNEELVIVGPSMGGQISRYALSYMEKEGIDHNTRLWVSIDSPHLGANIPIGLQTLLNQLEPDNAAAQDFVDNQLGSPAAKQQLIEQYHGTNGNQVNQNWLNSKTVSQGYNTNRGHPFFITYYNNLFNNGLPNSKGYPENLRKIALVNGSLEGNKKYFNPWTQSLDYYLAAGEMGFNARAFQSILFGNLHIGSLEAFGMPATGNNSKISRYKKSFSDNSKYISNLNTRGSLDQIPGGWFPGFQELANPIEGIDPIVPSGSFWGFEGAYTTIISVLSDLLGGADISVYDNDRVHSFIPVISALGFNNPNTSWEQEMNRNLVCTNETPFDTYFGPKNNERHTSFTEESVNWFLEELSENFQKPIVYYEGEDIIGPESICLTDMVTYEIPGGSCAIPPDEWQVSSNLNVIVENDTSITVQPINNTVNASGFIKAIYPFHTVQKNVWLGVADPPTFLNGPTEVHSGSMQTYTGGGSQGATSYKWLLPYPFEENNPIDFTSDYWQTWPNETGYNSHIFTGNGGIEGYVQLVSVNSCGEGGSIHLYVVHDNSGSCTTCYDPVLPYPNNANEDFKLDFTQHPDKTYHIYIYDQYSNVLYDGSSNNIEKTIDTMSLPNGTYFLHIHEDGYVTIKQLLIQH